jgi:hypothetical protein
MKLIEEAIQALAEMESMAQKVARQRSAEQDEKEAGEHRRKQASISKIVVARAKEQQKAETDQIEKAAAKKKAKAAAAQPSEAPKAPEAHEPEAETHAAPQRHSALQHLKTHGKFRFHVGKSLSPEQKLHNLHQVHKIHRKAADFYRRAAQEHPEGSPEHAKLHNRAHYYDSKADSVFSRINHQQHVG